MTEIYSHNNVNYSANGDMTLTPTSLTGKIELNGVCEITLEHNFDKESRYKYILEDSVIACPTPWSTKQLFRIYNVVKSTTGIVAYARHIYFDLNNYILIDTRPTLKSGQQALSLMLANTPFIGYSNISTVNTSYYVRKNIVEALAADDENSFVNIWGGERYLDNYNLTINSKIGGNFGVSVEFGYNLAEIEEDVNLDEVVTRIMPVGADGIMLSGSSPWVDSKNINSYANIKYRVINFDDVKVKENTDDAEGFDTLVLAQAELIRRCNLLFADGIDTPVVNYNVDMINLADTTEYKNYEVLETVNLGDTVPCKHSGLDINISARCISYEWEVTGDKVRYTNIELGNFKQNYFDNQSDITNRVSKVLNDNGTVKGESLEGNINALQTKFKAMKDIAQTQHIRAMLFEDLDVNSQTFGAMCIGTMGFEIASARNTENTDWNFRTFGTGKGFTADEIVAGVLKAIVLESVDGSCRIDLGTGIINISKGIIQGLNSSWNLDSGVFTTTETIDNEIYEINMSGGKIQAENRLEISSPYVVNIQNGVAQVLLSYGYDTTKRNVSILGNNVYLQAIGGKVRVLGDTDIDGNFTVTGTKNCIQATETYGDRLFYSVEDTDSYLTFRLSNMITTGPGTELKIPIDEVYKECVNTEIDYIVEINKVSFGDYRIKEQTKDYFIIESDRTNFEFKYTIVAKRKGYEDRHLDEYRREVV